MYGGQTAQYEAGKTPMAFNSVYAAQTPAADRTMGNHHGNDMPTGANQASQWGFENKSHYGGKAATDMTATYNNFGDNSNQLSQVVSHTTGGDWARNNQSQTADILTQGWGMEPGATTEIKNEGTAAW